MKAATLAHVPGESHHQPQLDGVRGVAILAVMMAHGVNFLKVVPLGDQSRPWAVWAEKIFLQGWGGVDLFFALSGFLITGILLRARQAEVYYTTFYMRRVLRIFPVYYLFLTVTLVGAYLTHYPALDMPHVVRWWLPYFFYVQNWPLFWASWAGMTTLWGAFWSLAVEEQFYLVWPALIRNVSVRAMLAFCVVGFLLGQPERMVLMRVVGVQLGVLQWPFSRLDGLFLGASIALYAHWRGRAVPLSWACAAFGVGGSIFVWLAVRHQYELLGSGPRIWSAGVTGFALMSAGVVAATQHRVPILHWLLTLRPLRVAGRLSYGMYVYHLLVYRVIVSLLRRSGFAYFGARSSPWMAVLVIATAIAAVTLVAEVSYRWFEKPFLGMKRFFPSSAVPLMRRGYCNNEGLDA